MKTKRVLLKGLMVLILLLICRPYMANSAKAASMPTSIVAAIEPNESKEQAIRLSEGIACRGEIGNTYNDIDWYSFAVEEGTKYRVHLDYFNVTFPGTFSLRVQLYANSDTDIGWIMGERKEDFVDFTAVSSGIYYVKLSSCLESSSHYYNIYYEVLVDDEDYQGYRELEPNNSEQTATHMDINIPCRGEIGSYMLYKLTDEQHDIDWYEFNFEKGKKYRLWMVNFYNTFGGTTLLVYLMDPLGNDKLIWRGLDPRSDYYDIVPTESGTYYLKLKNYVDFQTYGNHDYTLLLEGSCSIDGTPHSYGQWIVQTPATYTTAGSKTRTCSICGSTESEVIDPLHKNYSDHNIVLIDAAPATCIVNGYTGDEYCTDCKIVVKKGTTINKKPHGETYIINQKDPTCTEQGYTGDECCVLCDTLIKEGSVVAASHGEIFAENYKEATCTETGYSGDKRCVTCGELVSEGEIIPKNASNHANYPTTVWGKIDAACTRDGSTGDLYCLGCYQILERGDTIPKKGHSYIIRSSDSEVGCRRVCQVCKEGNAIVYSTGCSVSLNTEIAMSFHFEMCGFDLSQDEIYVILRRNGGDEKKIALADIETKDGEYVASYYLYADQMGDNISAQLFVTTKEGLCYTSNIDSLVCSIEAYGEKVLNDDSYSEETRHLVEALLNYGQRAYDFFSEETIIKNNSIQPVKYGSPKMTSAADLDIQGLTYLGCSLVCKSSLNMKYYFSVDKSLCNAQDFHWESDVSCENYMEDGYYVICLNNLLPNQLLSNLPVKNNAGNVFYANVYYDYVIKAEKSQDEKLAGLSQAIYYYADAASNYSADDYGENHTVTNRVLVDGFYRANITDTEVYSYSPNSYSARVGVSVDPSILTDGRTYAMDVLYFCGEESCLSRIYVRQGDNVKDIYISIGKYSPGFEKIYVKVCEVY